MGKLKIWTIDEYYNKMKEFFSSNQDDEVIKCFSTGSLSGAYQIWVKPSLMSIDKFADIYWNYEPLMKRYFDSKDELLDGLNPDIKTDSKGFLLRWLFREREIVYQVTAVHGDVNDYIDDYKITHGRDYLMGFKFDPFVYTGHVPIVVDPDGSSYVDYKNPDLKLDKNYSIFWEKITPEQFLEEEKLFTDPIKHEVYRDDLLKKGFEMKKSTQEFFRKHTDFQY